MDSDIENLYLREKLQIDEKNILLQFHKLRNHLVHFDERLDRWVAESKHRNFIDQNSGNCSNLISGGGLSECDYIRNFNSDDKVYSFYGEKFNIQWMECEIKKIKQHVEERMKEINTK